ncbi:MAG: hypothetical protein PHX13_05490 [Thiovulaceae bacterium]|nr:hypothetical protein [Sulfurimonadaceae bacterium]
MKKYLFIFTSLFLLGCNDTSQTFVYDKKILDAKIECMSLAVVPANKTIEDTLNSLYHFKKECAYELVVSYKNSITCNSNQNADKKVSGLPQSYLRMEIKHDANLQYTYYKDLQDNLSAKDVQNGFEKMKEELHF